MPSTPEEKKKVLTRVRRIRGQIDALERALENGAECRSILQQIAAVRGAANGLMAEVLESHIRETFDQNDSYSHEISKSVDDTIELVRAYLKCKRTARTVLTGMCYSVGSVMRQGSSSLTRLTGQSAMTSRTWRR